MTRQRLSFLLSGVIVLSCTHLTYAQDHQVSGRVTASDNSEALPGASILVKGTTIGTTSDADGGYSLAVPSPNDTLVFTFIGYQTLEEPIGGRTTIDVALVPQAIQSAEVIVVGYGAQEQQDITGAISSVTAQEIQELPVTDAGEALQGRASGVVALNSGNRPGQGVTIRVRGRRSLTASNEPLFVVDGIPLEGGLNDINPRDIESMEVLKDASATAIYGSRGANGVVIITTNRGGNHKTTVSYDAHVGISEVLGKPDMMTGEEFARMKEVAGREFSKAELDALAAGISTDYQDLLLERGYQQNHQLGIQGGDARTQFFVSANFFDEQGIINTQDFRRYALRLNLDHTVSGRFRFGTSSQITNVVQNWASNPYGAALAANPLSVPFDENGNLILRPGADPLIFNPLADLQDGAYVDERKSLRVFGNLFAELDILDNLQYRMNFGPDFQNWRRGLFQGRLSSARQEGTPLAQKEHLQQFTYTFENILTYTETFGRNHALDLTGVFSIQESNREESNIQSSDLPYESQWFHNIGTGGTIEALGSNLQEWGMMSFMGRANYQLMDRYLLTLTGRFDGSSRLAQGRKWGFFPSIALGWRLIEEPFMTSQSLFSDLKLRVSYGRTGNTAIAPYQTAGGLSRTDYAFGDSPAYGFRPSLLANPDLRWETSAQVNLGLDFGLWNDRVVGSFEVYRTHTTDLLLQRQLPVTSGFTTVFENIGETENRGYELFLSTTNVSSHSFSWTTDINLFGNREKILDLYGTGEDDIGNEWFIGEPLTVWYDYEKLGIWQLDQAEEAAAFGQEPGEIRVRDVNGDGIINEQDRVILGSDLPLMTGGMTNRFRYKSVDLSVFLFGSFGHTVYNNFRVENSTMQGRFNNLNVDYWTPDNPTNSDPKPNADQERPIYGSTRGYMPGDFLKVRNVQLGFTLPSSLLGEYGVRYARIYVNANTPLVFSYLGNGIDPEIYGGNVRDDNVPASTLYTIGVSVNF